MTNIEKCLTSVLKTTSVDAIKRAHIIRAEPCASIGNEPFRVSRHTWWFGQHTLDTIVGSRGRNLTRIRMRSQSASPILLRIVSEKTLATNALHEGNWTFILVKNTSEVFPLICWACRKPIAEGVQTLLQCPFHTFLWRDVHFDKILPDSDWYDFSITCRRRKGQKGQTERRKLLSILVA